VRAGSHQGLSTLPPQDIFENIGAHFTVFPVVSYAQVRAHCQALIDPEVRAQPAAPALGCHVSGNEPQHCVLSV